MKQRVLFCVENFQQGGINKALENIISLVDHSRIKLELFVINQSNGPYKEIFAPYLATSEDWLLNSFCANYRKTRGIKKLGLIALKTLRKIVEKFNVDLFMVYLNRYGRNIVNKEYDCIISYAEGYVTKFVSGIKGYKIAWVHLDYKRFLTYNNSENWPEIYSRYNYIVSPSDYSKESLIEHLPQLKNRVLALPNLINTDMVKIMAEEDIMLDAKFKTDKHVIISIGRICYEKGFTKIPEIAFNLKNKNIDFKWYVIGPGSDAETTDLKKEIDRYELSDTIILLGAKDNPYPYLKMAELLVSTSISETFSYVIFEAKTLGVPVVCNNFGTSKEIIEENEGVVCDISEMADVIYQLLTDRENLERYRRNLSGYYYNNMELLDRLYGIIQG